MTTSEKYLHKLQIVGAFSYSWKRKRELAIAWAELGLPKHKLTTETPTRWGSRQKMIQRLIEQERAISQLTRKQGMDVLETVNKVLSPLQEVTDALSGERYISVSYLKTVLHLFN
ncbi:Zinc finger BED domain-containing protein 4 [Merluccius polli]|uniref:Zinc finger BED domain-containing protein 4 n=1 Tax=Merluccius polli TaxID=89951 RepID=A0AA47NWE5_MERPO|nr:Zinc finger BED domain-containing protein 4 [Merluccius polli]